MHRQERLLQTSRKAITPHIPGNLPFDDLYHHMRRYARKNRTDYFVHAHVGAFLRAEFDYYLKNEYLLPEAMIDPKRVNGVDRMLRDVADRLSDILIKYQTLQIVGYGLIDMLDGIESFQARLFEKRKFVLQTDYLVAVRVLPESLHERVLANKAQLASWRTLFKLEGEITPATLRQHPTLVVDTRHFDADFKRDLFGNLEDIDGMCDGVLINAENYAALRTLEPTYRQRVKVIYIDPPYNTGNDGFLYKDDFSRHSTWLSMMESRLRLARELLAEDGVLFVSIDDHEQANLRMLLDEVFGQENLVATVIWQKVFSPKNTSRHFSDDHEYILVYARVKEQWHAGLLPRGEDSMSRYTNPDEDLRGSWASSDLTARNYYSEGTYEVISPSGKSFRPAVGTYWRVSRTNFEQLNQDNRIWWGKDGNNMPRLKRFISEVKVGVVPQTLWCYTDVGHTQDAKRALTSIVDFERSEDMLNTVKPVDLVRRVLQIGTDPDEATWVLDFFAGSGTTAQAVIAQNLDDGGARKFLLVEMDAYFERITLQRVLRSMYTPNWKKGNPQRTPQVFPCLVSADDTGTVYPDWVERSPRLVKILRLESYEDSLNALEPPPESGPYEQGNLFDDPALLRYLMPEDGNDSRVLLNCEHLENPFAYRLNIVTPAGIQETVVDIVETTNLFLGLHMRRRCERNDDGRRYVLVTAEREGKSVLVVWRDVLGLDPARERAFLAQQVDFTQFDVIYTNADSAIPNAQSLDTLLKAAMLADATTDTPPAHPDKPDTEDEL
jgi:adenine-specific DNA-methyltransferase